MVQNRIDFTNDNQLSYISCSLLNIKNHLPMLLDTQHEDVLRIEKCFIEGKGYLLTNGTGTGKTFCALGIIKRFLIQDKRTIIVVVPTDAKCSDWIKEGSRVGVDVYKLSSISDKGDGVRVTTYANYYQNDGLLDVVPDLIIYDESHYLNQNQHGTETSCLYKHFKMANVPSQARIKATNKMGPAPKLPRDLRDLHQKEIYDNKKKEWNKKHFNYYMGLYEKTKVLFMSATPFAYHKSIKYIDGIILEFNESVIEKKNKFAGYNQAIGFDKFLVETFGYQMKNNKCQKPPPEVDLDILERDFFESLVEQGVASTRVIDLGVDYSRGFYKIDSSIGDKIDEGIRIMHTEVFKKRYKILGEVGYRNFNYLRTSQILECIKAQKIKDRIESHLFLGRKIVIFHNYNKATPLSPFLFDPKNLGVDDFQKRALENEIFRFNKEYSDLVNMDLSELINVRETILKDFPNALEFNGTIPKKKRSGYIELFNKTGSGHDIIIVQTKAGREGISLHDIEGEAQRVIINLGLPVAPTQAIQEEGRIYRYGSVSNAIYEYVTLQTAFERTAFASKIARRAKTAENLAMGNWARDLESAFKEGYMNYNEGPPNIWQGRGGKKSDRVVVDISEWDRAKLFYYKRQKVNSKRRSGGVDFFSTPEPLGLKMVEWLDIGPGEKILEPSAGHGAISRFFPSTAEHVVIEPHLESASICEINSHGKILSINFENYNIMNKFSGVLMNPPFGTQSKTAFEHIEKASRHITQAGGIMYAIVPSSPSMDKRLNAWYENPEFENNRRLYVAGEMFLPSCTFEKAGTSVMTKIIKIIKWGWNSRNILKLKDPEDIVIKNIDLRYCNEIKEFFNALEGVKF